MVPTCLAERLWLLLACVVLSGSFPAVSGLYLLGCAFLAVARLLFPVRLASRRFSVVPAWLLVLRVSGRCNDRAVSEPAITGSQNKKREDNS